VVSTFPLWAAGLRRREFPEREVARRPRPRGVCACAVRRPAPGVLV